MVLRLIPAKISNQSFIALMPRSIAALLLPLLPAVLMGCQQRVDQAEKIAAAESGVCEQMAIVDAALERVAQLTPESTVGELQQARVALRDAMKGLIPYEKKLQQARYRDYDLRGKEVRQELRTIEADPDLTLAQASDRLSSKVRMAASAHEALTATVDCPAQ